MNKKEIDNQLRLYTYEELRDTFLAGSRMNQNTYSSEQKSWVRVFEEWITTLEKNRNNVVDLS